MFERTRDVGKEIEFIVVVVPAQFLRHGSHSLPASPRLVGEPRYWSHPGSRTMVLQSLLFNVLDPYEVHAEMKIEILRGMP
jgi:hypothetical protein